MQDILIAVLMFMAVAALFTIPVGLFNTRMFRGLNESRPTGSEFIKAYIPFFNVRYSRVLAYNSSPIYMALLCIAAVLFLLRFVAVGLVAADIGFGAYLVILTPITVMLAFVLWYVLAVVNAIDFGRMLGVGTLTMIVCIFCAPIGYYMLSNAVMPYFKKEETSLDGTFGVEN